MNKPFFIECTVPSVVYRGTTQNNDPVNLTFCISITKGRLQYYTDNEGIPTIVFRGTSVSWTYKTEAERDADYDRIMDITRKISRGEE